MEREREIDPSRAGPVVTALSGVDNRPISLRYLENLCMCGSTRALNGHSCVGNERSHAWSSEHRDDESDVYSILL